MTPETETDFAHQADALDPTDDSIRQLQARLGDGHRKIEAARAAGKPAEKIKAAEEKWCDLLAELNRALVHRGELEPTYSVNGTAFVTYGCEELAAEVRQ